MEAVGLVEKPFESSPLQARMEKDLRLVLQLRGKERMKVILSSDHPRELFQSLPEEEAYFTVKEIGEEDALPLLSLMSSTQCQYLLDLELWRGYEIQIDNIGRWLPLLLSCDEEAIHQWLRSLDIDTLLLILKKTIRIHLKDSEERTFSLHGKETYFTLDGIHYVEILEPSLQNQIEQLLRHLANLDLSFYWNILNQVSWEIGAELEERALHFREARLEDKGFPPMEEALCLYQHLNPKRLTQMLERQEIHLSEIPEPVSLPSFPMMLKDQNLFFSLCLKEVEEGPLMDRLKMELTYMANQVLVADQPETLDFSTLQGSLRKVGGYLSIGLELFSEGDFRRARRSIEQIPLKYLFQVGFGASLELKWRAGKVWQTWFATQGHPPSFLGSPWQERLEGLLKKRPLFYDEADMDLREFRSLEEIRSLHRDLDKIELIGRALSSLPPLSYSDGLEWRTVLLAAFATDQMGLSSQAAFQTSEEAISWLKRLHCEGVDIEDSFKNWFVEKAGVKNETETNPLKEITTYVLREMFS